jgi:hypothetical protein
MVVFAILQEDTKVLVTIGKVQGGNGACDGM